MMVRLMEKCLRYTFRHIQIPSNGIMLLGILALFGAGNVNMPIGLFMDMMVDYQK